MADVFNIKDNFNDNSIDTNIWTTNYTNGGTVTETGGQAVVTPNPSGTGYNAFFTSAVYNFIGSQLIIEVAQVCSVATSGDTFVQVNVDGSNDLEFIQEGGTLILRYNVAGVITTLTSFAYSATTHRWWRMRELNGTCFWDTSTDGKTWTNRASVANPITLTLCAIQLGAGTYIIENVGSAIFDNMNLPPINSGMNLPLLGVG